MLTVKNENIRDHGDSVGDGFGDGDGDLDVISKWHFLLF